MKHLSEGRKMFVSVMVVFAVYALIFILLVKNAVLLHGGTITARIAEKGGLQFDFTLKKE